ncbi:hypothetical protein NYE69_06880 [Paenibacillus sp. FSL R5-0527]|uniref:hypothetical protein n=1 Tax=Paenibacillus sp. FSL R5-0527 TaxID=2975321 RepID=UPI0026C17D59
MKTYQLIINGKKQGTVKTKDINGYLERTCPGVGYEIDGNKVLLSITLGRSMAIGLGLE